jgi:apolipoprotein D and lipocalin family protein
VKASLVAALFLAGCATYGTGTDTPPVARAVSLQLLEGTWYEVASFPGPFQSGCANTTATYEVRDDETVGVLNRCVRSGQMVSIAGTAREVGPGRLKVRLDGAPFAGDYWVLGLADDGKTLFVGTPSRIAGWVLSRDRVYSAEEEAAARMIFAQNGYDTRALVRTLQN